MLGVPRAAVVVAFLERLTVALEQDRVDVSEDARECALRDFGWTLTDITSLLYVVDEGEYSHHEPSTAPEGGMIWVFLHMTDLGRLWLRVCERGNMVVVSLHRG